MLKELTKQANDMLGLNSEGTNHSKQKKEIKEVVIKNLTECSDIYVSSLSHIIKDFVCTGNNFSFFPFMFFEFVFWSCTDNPMHKYNKKFIYSHTEFSQLMFKLSASDRCKLQHVIWNY